MAVQLKVPLVTQRLSNECWYASACMVAYYREAGPRQGLPDKWAANNGINVNDFIDLAKAEGLLSVLTPGGDVTAQQMEVMLKNQGPLWCAGFWDGVGHIVVVTGIDGNNVSINDPNPYKRERVETLEWFNQKRSRIPNAIMYKPSR